MPSWRTYTVPDQDRHLSEEEMLAYPPIRTPYHCVGVQSSDHPWAPPRGDLPLLRAVLFYVKLEKFTRDRRPSLASLIGAPAKIRNWSRGPSQHEPAYERFDVPMWCLDDTLLPPWLAYHVEPPIEGSPSVPVAVTCERWIIPWLCGGSTRLPPTGAQLAAVDPRPLRALDRALGMAAVVAALKVLRLIPE